MASPENKKNIPQEEIDEKIFKELEDEITSGVFSIGGKAKTTADEKGKKTKPEIVAVDKDLESIMARMKAAAEIGDEEEIKKLEKEFKEHKESQKTGEELFEEAQALEAGKEFRENEKLLELEKEVEIARKKYAGADYETNSALARIKKFLHIKYNPANNKEELDLNYSEYRNKLNELLSLKVDELKSRNLEKDEIGKEMKDLLKYFDFDEKVNLRNAYTESRAEAIEKKFGKAPGLIINKGSYLLSGYGKFSKKLGFTGKTALSYALIGTGLFGAVAVNRFLGSALIAKGVIAKSEVNLRERQQKASEARALEIVRQLETSNKVYDDFVNMMQQQSVGDYKSVLENERKEGWKRIGKGLAAAGATFAVSKTLSHFMQDAWGPAKEHISEFLEKIGVYQGAISVEDLHPSGIDKTPSFPETQSEAIEKPLIVEKESSLEGTLIKHLEETGMEHNEAGRQADIFMRRYAEDKGIPFEKLNHVLPGQELELNPDGTVKNIPGFESAAGAVSTEPEIEAVPDDIKEPEIETNAATEAGDIKADDIASVGIDGTAAAAAPENLPNLADSYFGRNVSYILDDLDKHINENTSELSWPETHDAEELAAFREKIADLGYSKGFLENFRDHVFQGNTGEATKSFRSAISLDEKWENIKDMNFREAAKNMNWRASDKLDTIFKCLKETLGNDARPGSRETLEKWTERVSKLAIEKTK